VPSVESGPGQSATGGRLDALVRAAPSTLFVVDRLPADVRMWSNRAHRAQRRDLAIRYEGLRRLRGLRLGYLVADAEVARVVQAALPAVECLAPGSPPDLPFAHAQRRARAA